jgi:transposase
MFEQVHEPGEAIQSDFTHAGDLGVSIAGEGFPHLLFHSVLTYSNVEAVGVCFSESFEALAEGLEAALGSFGGVPRSHRTDNLSAAIRELGREGRRDFTVAYRGLLDHYGLIGSTNHRKRSANPALDADDGIDQSGGVIATFHGSSRSMSSTVVAVGRAVNMAQRYA